jgi:hypothetical protein
LLYATAKATFTTGAPDLYVYAVQNDTAKAEEHLLWKHTGAATTVLSPIPILPKQAPISPPAGWKIVVLYLDTSTPDVTAGTIQIVGDTYRWSN